MRNFVGLLVVGVALTVGGQAEAQVVTFNELSPTTNPILTNLVCADPSGFRFLSDHFHVIGTLAGFEGYSSNDTTYIGYESGRGFPIAMERVGDGTFSLLSLDAAEFYAVPVPDRPDAQMLTITGFQQGGGTVSYTVSLDGIRDGSGGVMDFEHVVLPSTFVDLTSVVFTGLRVGNESGGVALDNIEYQLAVAEPLAACVIVPEAPTVVITSPVAGAVSGTVLVQATATDNLGVAGVQFKLDGVSLGPEVVVGPYTESWDTTTVADGPHTITAEARDVTGNLGTTSVVVTVRNSPVTSAPYYIDLDGINDYLEAADADSLSFVSGGADTPLTVETWFRPDTMVGKQNLVSKWLDGLNQEYKLYIAAGTLRLDLRDSSAQATVSAYATSSQTGLVGGWHHLAVTYDGRGGATAANGITFYIDGVAVPVTHQNSAAYVAMENWSAALQIGRESTNWKQYDGALDELRLWNVARTLSEIQASMASELSGAEPGLVAYWRFDDGTGTTATDSSPANHMATLYNEAAWVAGGPLGPLVR